MTEQESIESRLARIEEHIRNIDQHLQGQIECRHVMGDGKCDFYESVVEHDRKINQWTGALAAVALICSFIGSLIGFFMSKVMK